MSLQPSHMEGINPERAAMLEEAARGRIDSPVAIKLEAQPPPTITGANLAPVGNPSNSVIRRSESREEGEVLRMSAALPPRPSLPLLGFQAGATTSFNQPQQKRPGGLIPAPAKKKRKKGPAANEQLSRPLSTPRLDPPPTPDANTSYLQSLLQVRPFRLTLLPYGKGSSQRAPKELELNTSIVGLLQQQMISQWNGIPMQGIQASPTEIHKPDYALVQAVEGKLLEDIWSSLSSAEKFEICRGLRNIVTRMRKTCTPGPVGSATSGPWSLLLDKHPMHSYYAIRAHGDGTQFLAFLASSFYETVPAMVSDVLIAGFPTDSPLTLTHGELCPRNILVKGNSIAAIIGWDSAGWYPRWWEFVKFFEATTHEKNADWYDYAETIFTERSMKELALYQGLVRCQRV